MLLEKNPGFQGLQERVDEDEGIKHTPLKYEIHEAQRVESYSNLFYLL